MENEKLKREIEEIGRLQLLELEDEVWEKLEKLRESVPEDELLYAVGRSGFWPILLKYFQ